MTVVHDGGLSTWVVGKERHVHRGGYEFHPPVGSGEIIFQEVSDS